MLVNWGMTCADRKRADTNVGSDDESNSSLLKSGSLSGSVDIIGRRSTLSGEDVGGNR